MKRWLGWLLVAILLMGLGVWGWRFLFPSPEKVIRARLNRMAQLATFAGNEGPLAKLGNAEELAGCFTSDVAVAADSPGAGPLTLHGRDNLLHWLLGVRANLSALKVEFLDIQVTIHADGRTALAYLTCKAAVPGEPDFAVQEFNFLFSKTGRNWLVYKIETVKTLSRL